MSNSFQEEGSWNLSFSGAGLLGLYHVGVTQCLRERAPRLLQGAGRFYGSSSGAIQAICILLGKSAGVSRGPHGGRAGRAGGLSGGANSDRSWWTWREGCLRTSCLVLQPAVFPSCTLSFIPCASLGDSGDGHLLSQKRDPRVRAGKTIPKVTWGQKAGRTLERRAGHRTSQRESLPAGVTGLCPHACRVWLLLSLGLSPEGGAAESGHLPPRLQSC